MEKITRRSANVFQPFPIPGANAESLLASILNQDLGYGPVFAILEMKPGAWIPAHIHYKTPEQHFVLEGDFINDGVEYGPGDFLFHDAGTKHGPHTTMGGCKLIFIQSAQVDPTDFQIAE